MKLAAPLHWSNLIPAAMKCNKFLRYYMLTCENCLEWDLMTKFHCLVCVYNPPLLSIVSSKNVENWTIALVPMPTAFSFIHNNKTPPRYCETSNVILLSEVIFSMKLLMLVSVTRVLGSFFKFI